MLLKPDASDKDLTDATKLEVWNMNEVLVKGRLPAALRALFFAELCSAAHDMALALCPPAAAPAPKKPVRCMKRGDHKHYGKTYDNNPYGRHDTKGRPLAKK